MELSYAIKEGYPAVTVLNVAGRVDGSTYQALIDQARELFDSGTNNLLLNLEACNFMSSAGLFALHNIALMAHKFEPISQEDGWGAMRIMTNETRNFKDRFKMVNVPDNIKHTFDVAGLTSIYDIYKDMDAALAAFRPSV